MSSIQIHTELYSLSFIDSLQAPCLRMQDILSLGQTKGNKCRNCGNTVGTRHPNNCGHLSNSNLWITDCYQAGFQTLMYLNNNMVSEWHPKTKNVRKPVWYSNGIPNVVWNIQKLYLKFTFQTKLKICTICRLDFLSFEHQTNLVFRSWLHSLRWKTHYSNTTLVWLFDITLLCSCIVSRVFRFCNNPVLVNTNRFYTEGLHPRNICKFCNNLFWWTQPGSISRVECTSWKCL